MALAAMPLQWTTAFSPGAADVPVGPGENNDERKRRGGAETDSHDRYSSPDEMASTTRNGPSSAR